VNIFNQINQFRWEKKIENVLKSDRINFHSFKMARTVFFAVKISIVKGKAFYENAAEKSLIFFAVTILQLSHYSPFSLSLCMYACVNVCVNMCVFHTPMF